MKRSRWGTFYAVWWPQHRILKVGMTTNERRRWRALCLNTGGQVIYAQRGLPYMAERAALRALRTRYRQAFASEQEATRLLSGGRGFTETFIIPSGDYHPPMLAAIKELEPYGLREAEAADNRPVDRRAADDARSGREVDGGEPIGVRGRSWAPDTHRLDTPACGVPARRAIAGAVRFTPARAGDRGRDRAVRGGRDRVLRHGQHAGGAAQETVAVPAAARGLHEAIKKPTRRLHGLGERGRERERGRAERGIKKRSIPLLPDPSANPRHGRTMCSLWTSPPGPSRVLEAQQGHDLVRDRGHPRGMPTAHPLHRGGRDPRLPQGYALSEYPSVEVRVT